MLLSHGILVRLGWLTFCFGFQLAAGQPSPSWDAAADAEARQDWVEALSTYEALYDSTRLDEPARTSLWKKFAQLRPRVAPNIDPNKAGVWKVRAYVFRELDFAWTDKQGKSHRAQHRYRADEIDRLRRGLTAFAARVWEFTSGSLRIDWDLTLVDKPLTKLDGEESFWPGPDACMPYFADLEAGRADTIMVFAKAFGDPAKGETGVEVPQMLLGGAIGVVNPLTRGATYIGFNWGSGTAGSEPDGEPMLHEWLHSAQWALEERQGYPPGLMCSSDGGRMEGEEGGDPCYRRRPDEHTWMRFYEHIMRDHVTRAMWRGLTPSRPPTNVWVQAQLQSPYVDPSHLECPWPKMSHYKQPWRGYIETRSGRDFLQGLGVNLHIPDGTEELAIRLLAETGLKSFRIEIGWGEMSWDESRLNNENRFRSRLSLCNRYGVRPTLLLNAHQGVPCPLRFLQKRLLQPAHKGQSTLLLDDLSGLVAGRSGLNGLSDYWAAEALIVALDPQTGEARLSKTLTKDLPAGPVQMATLKFAPLHPVGTPEYDETTAAWVRYALHICRLAKDAGLEEFDLEIWNELTFGTHFLNINDYYDADRPKVSARQPDFLNEGGRCWELAKRTVEAVKGAYPRTRVIWGFSNTTFHHCRIDKLPPGIDGQSYHPYGTATREIKGKPERSDQPALEGFVPSYTLRMPEGWAPTFIQTECLIRLLRPDARLETKPSGTSRFFHYITEHGVLASECGVKDPAEAWQLKALCATRSYCLWLNKGVDVLHFFDAFEAEATSFGLLPTNLSQLDGGAPFQEVATPPMRAIRNLAEAFAGSLPLQRTDSLQFEVTPLGPQAAIFEGDEKHPPLWEKDVLAILPFQLNAAKHAVALYVMTRDATRPFPPAPFRIRISGVKGHRVDALDVTSGQPVLVCTRDAGSGAVEVTLFVTDRPVILGISR